METAQGAAGRRSAVGRIPSGRAGRRAGGRATWAISGAPSEVRLGRPQGKTFHLSLQSRTAYQSGRTATDFCIPYVHGSNHNLSTTAPRENLSVRDAARQFPCLARAAGNIGMRDKGSPTAPELAYWTNMPPLMWSVLPVT